MTTGRNAFQSVLLLLVGVSVVLVTLAALSALFPPLQWMFLEGVLGISKEASELVQTGPGRYRPPAPEAPEAALKARLRRLESIFEDLRQSLGHGDGLYLLSRGLRSGRPDLQVLAVEGLGLVPDVQALDLLVQALADPGAAVREAAFEVLAEKSEARSRVSALLSGSPQAGAVDAVRLLGVWGEQDDARLLVGAWERSSQLNRSSIRQSLDRIDPEVREPVLLEALASTRYHTRLMAAQVLAAHDSEAAREAMLAAVRGGDTRLREAGVRALGDMALRAEGYARTAGEVDAGGAWTLARDQAVAALVRLMADPVPEVRREAAAALARSGATRAGKVLLAGLTDPVPHVRIASHMALAEWARVSEPDAVLPALFDGLQAAAPESRRGAVEVLEAVPGSQALDALLAARSHPDPGVREAVAAALARRGAPLDRLLAMAGDPDARVRRAVLAALALYDRARLRGGDLDQALDLVLPALDDPDIVVRETAMAGLRELAVPAAVERLVQALRREAVVSGFGGEDMDDAAGLRSVRRQSLVQALGTTGDVRAVSVVGGMLIDPDPAVRSAAESALVWLDLLANRVAVDQALGRLPEHRRRELLGRLRR